jgi:replicative DNA helicase
MSNQAIHELREAQVVATALSRPELFHDIALTAMPSVNFQSPYLRGIFNAIGDQIRRGEQPEIITAVEHASKTNEVEAHAILNAGQVVADQAPLDLPQLRTTLASVARWGKRCRILRELEFIGYEMDSGKDPLQPLENLVRKFQREGLGNRPAEPIDSTAMTVADEIEEQLKQGVAMSLKTGLFWLDDTLRIPRSGLVFFGAREKSGKTWVIQQLAISLAKRGERVFWASTEMDHYDVNQRIWGTYRGVHWLMNRDAETPEDVEQLRNAARAKPINGVFFEMTNAADDLLDRMELLVRSERVSVVLVDYLQDFAIPSSFGRDHEGLATFVQRLKDFARRHRVPVIGVSAVRKPQHDHASESFPQVSQLFGTAKIAYTANAIVLMHMHTTNPDMLEFRVARSRGSAQDVRWFMRRDPATFELEKIPYDEARRLIDGE